MAILSFLESTLSAFRHCFNRTPAYRWFVVVICALMVRTDHLGVTSIIRSLSLSGKRYESVIHFFRSKAYSLSELRKVWYTVVLKSGTLYQLSNRNLLIGDGTKEPKEGRYMPAVKKLFQESENACKPRYTFGHMYGGVAAVIERDGNCLACPLNMNIQDGLAATASWDGSSHSESSHIVQMIRNGYEATQSLGPSYMTLDRYFLSVPGLEELDKLNESEHLLDLITRAKDSCVAYEPLPSDYKPKRGRPRKKGDSVKLKKLFEEREADFVTAEVTMYGEQQQVEYLCLDLLWGIKLYKKLRFVLVKSARGRAILVSTDLSLSPELIIEAYAHRFKIESMFREFKQQIGGFCYHFWTKAVHKLNRYKKKGEPDALALVTDEKSRNRILMTVEATERFVFFSCVAMGLVQMMALTPSIAEQAQKVRYLRTQTPGKVSEATILSYLAKNFYRLLLFRPDSGLSRIIRDAQRAEDGNEIDNEVA